MNLELLNQLKKIKSLAEAGLVYNHENYDAERYEELRKIALEMMAMLSQTPVDKLQNFYIPETDYPTPKVDVRGLLLNEKNEFLMVKESVDDCWTLPGGWADIGLTPTENVIKEMQEETGLRVSVKKLVAVFDKKCYPDHPPQPHYVYKLVYLCEKIDGEFNPNFDIQGVNWFSLDNLPELSADRVVKEQLQILMDILTDKRPTHSD